MTREWRINGGGRGLEGVDGETRIRAEAGRMFGPSKTDETSRRRSVRPALFTFSAKQAGAASRLVQFFVAPKFEVISAPI